MLHDSSVGLLARLPLFAGLNTAVLEWVVDMSDRRVFRPPDPVIAAGGDGSAACLIISGYCERLTPEGDATGQTFGPGSILGEMAMFVDTVPDSTVVAREIVTTIQISQSVIGEIVKANPGLASVFASRIRERLAVVQTQMKTVKEQLDRITLPEIAPDQTPPAQAHGRKAAPNHAPRRPLASNRTTRPAPVSPIHGRAAAPGSSDASPARGSSTR